MTAPLTRQPQQKALLLESKQGRFVLGANIVPSPGEGQILVKIKSTALNPVDWKIQKAGIFVEVFPAVIGTDLAGDVVQVGPGVTRFNPGDKVFCQGQYNNQYATFQEYALADEVHLAKIPDNITYDQAATLPVALTAAYVGLFNAAPYGVGCCNPAVGIGLADKNTPIVVLGGATSVGQYVIQLAKVAGFAPIITTASLKHAEYLKSLGATAVLDRNLPLSFIKEGIEKVTSNPIKLVFDGVSDAQTQQIGYDILAPGGNLVLLLQPTVEKSAEKNIVPVLGVRVLPHNIKLLAELYAKLPEWLENGTIKPNRVDVLPGGLVGIVNGLVRMEQNQVSGVKLVARPEETVIPGQN